MYTIEELQDMINREIKSRSLELYSYNPAGLYSPVSYSLEEGGKRLRPLLLLMAYNLFLEDMEAALPAALAVEVFHNFTLLHDDIMDKAEMRRNKPTVHVRFSENTAILSGDAMAFLSYQYLMECRSKKMLEILGLFTQTALEVCEGQQYDMEFENLDEVAEPDYMEMIRLKTAVLLGCSLKSGALLANAPEETTRLLYKLGLNLGLAFQIQDDWLDAFGNSKDFGKKIGGDILAGKKTYLIVKAFEIAGEEEKIELHRFLKSENLMAEEKINSVLKIYERLGIRKLAEEKRDTLFANANSLLHQLDLEETKKVPLNNLIVNMQKRIY